jgi:hypothetical protein
LLRQQEQQQKQQWALKRPRRPVRRLPHLLR